MGDKERRKIVIWGSGGHAMAVANAAEASRYFEVIGFLDDVNPEKRPTQYPGKEILGGREALDIVRQGGVRDIALGFGDCSARIQIGLFLREKGFSVPKIIHPFSVISQGALIGEGTVVLAGAVIGAWCKVGKYCIVNNNATISHQSEIEEGVHICPGVSIAGNVRIGEGAWIGIGTTVIENISIGERSFIGAGSTVIANIPGGVLAFGSPARVIRNI